MSRQTRPPSGGTPRLSRTPEGVGRGVTCPACGLANEPAARVCRNCGLPIASATDPLRGVSPGRVDMPSAKRSGLSAIVGLALVMGLLIVGGTLAVSGGGILTSGGRLGVDALASPPGDAAADGGASLGGTGQVTAPGDGPLTDVASDGGGRDSRPVVGTSFGYTCEDDAIADLSGSRWSLSQFQAGLRRSDEGDYERITWEMSRRGKARQGTGVTMTWLSPGDAKAQQGASLVNGTRAIVVTFDGPVDITAGQKIDQLSLEPEGVHQIRTIDMYEGEDGDVRTVIGIRGESCARMSATGWRKKGETRIAKVYLDVEKP